jgi:glycosyltransferase involved in cell wall biosynthesis
MNALNHPSAFQAYQNAQAEESKPLELVPAIDELRSPLISLVIPAYNEAAILQENLNHLYEYMIQTAQKFRWEFVIINDGSRDETGRIAADFARDKANVVIVHHPSNQGLGRALKSGFAYAGGDYIITLDIDLSYAPYHIKILLDKILETQAQIVVASPYMPGGRVSNVPRLRKELSLWANRFLSLTDKRTLSTFTGMVRIYDAQFLKGLNLKSMGMDINPEIIHKAQLLGVRIEEAPAHLHWVEERGEAQGAQRPTPRQSSMKIFRHTWAILFYGFLFRPVMFFILPSIILFLLSLYANTWAIIHCISNYQKLLQLERFPDPTVAVANAFQAAPHTFILGGMFLMLSIQLFSLGILAVQSKSYFEEIYYLASAIFRQGAQQSPQPGSTKLL